MAETPTTPTTPTPLPKRDWNNLIANSRGPMFRTPSELLEQAKAWQAKRLEFSKEANRLAKMENEISLDFQKLIYALRKFFEDAGRTDIWTCDIGFNTEALKEGEYIIDVLKAERTP